MRFTALLCAAAMVTGCQGTMRTRTSPGKPTIEEEGSCDSAQVRSDEACTERTVPVEVPTVAIIAAVVIAGLAAAPAFEAFHSVWPPE